MTPKTIRQTPKNPKTTAATAPNRVKLASLPIRKPNAPPRGLGATGKAFWIAICTEHDLGPAQLALLEQACRQLDVSSQLRQDLGDGILDLRKVESERRAVLAAGRLIKDLTSTLTASRKPVRRETPTPKLDAADPRSELLS